MVKMFWTRRCPPFTCGTNKLNTFSGKSPALPSKELEFHNRANQSGHCHLRATKPTNSPCSVHHKAPALAFSVGGLSYSFFHTFNDGSIPLFITINSISQENQESVFVLVDYKEWWVRKPNLARFHDHRPKIDAQPKNNPPLPRVTRKNLLPSPSSHFHHRETPAAACADSGGIGCVLLNQAEVKRAAGEEGFEVIEFEPDYWTTLYKVCEVISSSQLMLGVHGAALTYKLFPRPGSVLMQVGGDWIGLENVLRESG
ncbi:xylan glycosyltransferase MUCI21-like [Actinidia eriantha]|uniref:xylan glycosyltransferase MUCI21-like n=1 Tax=Actinidia eriantha TaxID=165200 RepID=UPI00258BACC6|nr:xylan glycosyltransferase MUCI21-like [Actinidia eriantha]